MRCWDARVGVDIWLCKTPPVPGRPGPGPAIQCWLLPPANLADRLSEMLSSSLTDSPKVFLLRWPAPYGSSSILGNESRLGMGGLFGPPRAPIASDVNGREG